MNRQESETPAAAGKFRKIRPTLAARTNFKSLEP